MFSPVVAKRGNVTIHTFMAESVLPDKETIKAMKAAGYKFYQDGKLWKPEVTKKQTAQN